MIPRAVLPQLCRLPKHCTCKPVASFRSSDLQGPPSSRNHLGPAMTSPGLAALQLEAYTHVCRAFYAQASLSWEQEDVLTTLRNFWNIDNQTHGNITTEMRSDPDVLAVRGGGMPARLGRGKAGGAAAPAPSIGDVIPAAAHLMSPLAGKRQGLQQAPAGSGLSGSGGSLYCEGADSGRSKHAKKAAGKKGGGGGAKARPGSLAQQPSSRRPSRPSGAAAVAAPGAVGMAGGGMQRMASGLQRSRSTRQAGSVFGGAADPLQYVGRRLWRFWPMESPPWVEGFIQQWDQETDGYTVVYDPNTRDSTEEVFQFSTAVDGVDYVVGEYVDMASVHGSRRQHDKPYVSPEALQQPMPPGLMAAMAPPPSKKRKSTSGAPVPADAPFEVTYLTARLPVAQEDELQQMLSVLERKERVVEAEINLLEYQETNREDIERRSALERRFQELCDREAALMAEMATLRAASA